MIGQVIQSIRTNSTAPVFPQHRCHFAGEKNRMWRFALISSRGTTLSMISSNHVNLMPRVPVERTSVTTKKQTDTAIASVDLNVPADALGAIIGIRSLCSYLTRFCFLRKRHFYDIVNRVFSRARLHDPFSIPQSHSSQSYQLPPPSAIPTPSVHTQ